MMWWNTAAPLLSNMQSISCGQCCSHCVIQALRFGRQLPTVWVSWLSVEERATARSAQVRPGSGPRELHNLDVVGRLIFIEESYMMSFCWSCLRGPEAIPLLVRVIQSPDSRNKENVNATENCISAVGKVMRFRPECVNVNEILPHWLSWLPLNEDKEEAVHTFDFLCDLIERYNWSHLNPP